MNIKKIILLTAVTVTLNANAQSKKAIKDAELTYASANYCDAASKCAIAYSKITKNTQSALKLKAEYAFRTGESYRMTDDAVQAAEWYEKAVLLKYYEKHPEVYLYLGDMYRMTADFKSAEKNYNLYLQKVPGDARAEIGLKNCKDNAEFKANRTRHTITPVNALNKEGFDMSPMFVDKKDQQLAFATTSFPVKGADEDPITCGPYMDIYVAEIAKNGTFNKVAPIEGDSINTEDSEGTLCIDGRAKTMFFTRCPSVKKENLGCDIWMSEAGSKGWEKPIKLNLKNGVDSISVGHPCVSEDGKFLIFASDDPSGLGGRDLWYTVYDKRTSTWSTPQNMGPEINTAGDELFPSLAKNGDLIYSSNGMPGMGGLDLYRATKIGTDNKWENPTNYGAPINSDHNDYSMVEIDDRSGYFTSERKGGQSANKPDIYKYELPPNLFTLRVNVFDLSDPKRGTMIAGVKVMVQGNNPADKWEGLTASDGSIFWDKRPNGDRYINENSSYKIMIGKEKYYEDKKGAEFTTVGLKYDQDFVIDMGLYPIKPIKLPEVRYIVATHIFVNDSTINSLDSLNYVITMLDENPGLVIELSSHTDPRGGTIYNQVLSENRSKACYEYLVKQKGVDPRRIVPVGRGESQPRKVFLMDGKYYEKQPVDPVTNLPNPNAKEIVLTEAYMNPFKKTDRKKFEVLQQFNRRTEAAIVTLDFDPAKAPPANPDYLVFKKLPPSNK